MTGVKMMVLIVLCASACILYCFGSKPQARKSAMKVVAHIRSERTVSVSVYACMSAASTEEDTDKLAKRSNAAAEANGVQHSNQVNDPAYPGDHSLRGSSILSSQGYSHSDPNDERYLTHSNQERHVRY